MLGMDPGCRVDELDVVVHRLVFSHRGEMLDIFVCMLPTYHSTLIPG